MKIRLVIRDNTADRSVELFCDLPPEDAGFLTATGDRIARESGWDLTLLALEVPE